MKFRFVAPLALVVVLGASTALYQNCAAPDVDTPSTTNSSSTDVTTGNFVIYPSTVSVFVGAQQPFSITGGTPPYSYAINPTGCGTFDPTSKVYTAPSTSTICTLSIRDQASLVIRAMISVGNNTVSATYSPNPAPVGAGIQISAVGGTPGYTYTLVSGKGTLSGAVYTSASTETATIRIQDAGGQTYTLSLPVGTTSGTQTIYTSVNAGGDYLQSISSTEGPYAGYTYIDNVSLFGSPGTTRTEVRRCYNPSVGHSVALGACSGTTDEGSFGYVDSVSSSAGSRTIVNCSNGVSSFLSSTPTVCTSRGLTVTQIGYGP